MFSISPIIVLRKIIHINSTIYVAQFEIKVPFAPLLLGGGVGEAEKVGSFAKIAGAEEPRREARCGWEGEGCVRPFRSVPIILNLQRYWLKENSG